MIKCDRVIIVEGKYDKINLCNIVDAVIIPTNGFGIFKDKEKRAIIKRLALQKGIVILTDSDSAGLQIRSYIKNICGDADIINVYIPQLKGKEKRKEKPSKEGFVGVEGVSKDIIIDAFKRSGIIYSDTKTIKQDKITKQTLYLFGLSGSNNSAKLRDEFASFLELPKGMSSSAFTDALNSLFTKSEFERQVELWRQETDKK